MNYEVVLITIYSFLLVSSLLLIVSLWVIYRKANRPGWTSLVPLYNYIVQLEIVGLNKWYALLMFVPIINIIFGIYTTYLLALSYGKKGSFITGMIFLPVIFYPMIAFGKSKHLGDQKDKIKSNLVWLKANWHLYALLIPGIIWYLLFQFKPLLGTIIAFQDYSPFKGILGSEWVGLANFAKFLNSPYFVRALRNTLVLNFYGIIFAFPIPIIFALMVNELKSQKLRNIVQSFTFVPYFISVVVMASIVLTMLAPVNGGTGGIVNIIIEKLGFESIYFKSRTEFFRPIFIGTELWQQLGRSSVIYIAALVSIDPQLYEAAKVDGVNKFQEIFYITLPSIMPTVIIMLILRIGRMLNIGFEKVLLLYMPATYEVSDVISTLVYREGLTKGNYSYAAAIGLFNAIVALILVYGTNKLSKKLSDTSLF